MNVVADLGQLGTTGGILRPLDLTLQRDGAVWNLTGYTAPVLRVRRLRTHTAVAPNGTVVVQTAASGIVRYTPGAADPLFASSGSFEARVWLTPDGGGAPEPSGLFRFTIGDGPN